ncbi:MAG: hypothetical protein O2960_22010, partial [Verrucomicrobia bacterium]|nr:hypothetical protein [Verrucomicrobiota bacterium]
MLSSQCNGGVQPAGCKTRDGKLWFPTTRGVVVIDPAKIQTNTRPPDVLIEVVRANDEIIFDKGNPIREVKSSILSPLVPGASPNEDRPTLRTSAGDDAPTLP